MSYFSFTFNNIWSHRKVERFIKTWFVNIIQGSMLWWLFLRVWVRFGFWRLHKYMPMWSLVPTRVSRMSLGLLQVWWSRDKSRLYRMQGKDYYFRTSWNLIRLKYRPVEQKWFPIFSFLDKFLKFIYRILHPCTNQEIAQVLIAQPLAQFRDLH